MAKSLTCFITLQISISSNMKYYNQIIITRLLKNVQSNKFAIGIHNILESIFTRVKKPGVLSMFKGRQLQPRRMDRCSSKCYSKHSQKGLFTMQQYSLSYTHHSALRPYSLCIINNVSEAHIVRSKVSIIDSNFVQLFLLFKLSIFWLTQKEHNQNIIKIQLPLLY